MMIVEVGVRQKKSLLDIHNNINLGGEDQAEDTTRLLTAPVRIEDTNCPLSNHYCRSTVHKHR